MEFLTELWLPIVLAAVFVFIASSVIHMVLPIHKSDVKKMKNEDQVLEAMRANGVEPGNYMFPCAASMKVSAWRTMSGWRSAMLRVSLRSASRS